MALDPRNPRVQKGFLGAIFLSAVIYVYFFTEVVSFTYKANASELDELEETYLELSKDLNKARQAINRLPYLEKEHELLGKKWEQGKTLLPEDEEMIDLLRRITLLGTGVGVEFTMFKPLKPRPQQGYTELPIEVTVGGGYHEVGSFLAEVGNMKRIVNVGKMRMQTMPEREAMPGQAATATFEAVAYRLGGVLPEDAEAEGAKPKSKRTKHKSNRGGE